MLFINTHFLTANTAYRSYQYHLKMQGKYMMQLATGKRINSAADDAAGLAISEKMRAQIRGMQMAVRNTQDTISLIQTAEGGLNETHSILQRIRELTVKAANDTYSDEDRQAIMEEVKQLIEAIDDIAGQANFNTIPLLDGSFQDKKFQTGPNQGDSFQFSIGAMTSSALGIADLHEQLGSHEGANEALDKVEEAIKRVSSQRSSLGAYQNRLEHRINYLENAAENLQAAESRIRDADIAKAMMEYTKHSILMQATMAVMAQANQQAYMVLKLLEFPKKK